MSPFGCARRSQLPSVPTGGQATGRRQNSRRIHASEEIVPPSDRPVVAAGPFRGQAAYGPVTELCYRAPVGGELEAGGITCPAKLRAAQIALLRRPTNGGCHIF
jgi:hypothetical protein